MPEQLLAYAKHAVRKITEKLPPDGHVEDALGRVCVIVRARTGHDFSQYKENTILRRIDRRMVIHQLDNLDLYVRFLQHNPQEVDLLFRELLIGVTNFFRDPEAFEALEKRPLPALLEKKAEGEQVRVWVPGCSTGEEAYSVAMAIHDIMKTMNKEFEVQIFATDIDTNAIDIARAGVYPSVIAPDVKPDRLERFLVKENGNYRIKKEVRETVVFASQNLIKDPPFTRLDLICCRNVMIYLKAELQKKLIPLFHYSLRPGGILFLGSSETIGGFVDLFRLEDKKWKIYSRRDSVTAGLSLVDFPLTAGSKNRETRSPEKRSKENVPLPLALERLLLEKFVPPSVLINQQGDIIHLHGRTGEFLEPPQGSPKFNIIEMAREGLRLQLSSAMRKAKANKKNPAARTSGSRPTAVLLP